MIVIRFLSLATPPASLYTTHVLFIGLIIMRLACLCPGMHYYYGSMNKTTPCDQVSPWYPVYEAGELIEIAFVVIIPRTSTNWEHPPPAILKVRLRCVYLLFTFYKT